MFSDLFMSLPPVAELADSMRADGGKFVLTGLAPIHKAAVLAALAPGGPVLVITADEAGATRLVEDINNFAGRQAAALFPAREFTFREVEGASMEYEHQRLGILTGLAQGRQAIIAASVEAITQYTTPPALLAAYTRTLSVGDSCPLDTLVALLQCGGYQRRDQVDAVGQYAVRGGILDFFPPFAAAPIRMELWGDEIDTIAAFDPDSQRRTEELPAAVISPAREVLLPEAEALAAAIRALLKKLGGDRNAAAREVLSGELMRLESGIAPANPDKFYPLVYPTPATLLDYTPHWPVATCELSDIRETMKAVAWQRGEDITTLLTEGALCRGCDEFYLDFAELLHQLEGRSVGFLESFSRTTPEFHLTGLAHLSAVTLSSWGGDLAVLSEDLAGYLRRGFRVALSVPTDRAALTLAEDLAARGISATAAGAAAIPAGTVRVLAGSFSAGMELPDLRFALIPQQKAAVRSRRLRRRGGKPGEQIRSLSDIRPGDLVVHAAHGIGSFVGVVKREIHGITKDYLQIRYAAGDALFVPVTQLDLVSKYIGPQDDSRVKLNRLGSADWQKTRQRVKRAVAEMAEELIQLYAARAAAEGFAFSEDTDWQRDFEARFPYEETDDQLRCIEEIKADMESPRPMDRLLCGDVGFGKTEVAIRAAFKCVLDSKQCAVLVPTTILAWQHYQTFLDRMQGFPIQVELLSRFRTPKQQEAILRKLRRGEVDIVIGTHRLLQKDIQFKDLGLLVIDEEQRFGVAHKEKFKELRHSVDVLTLSATPIPRTLNMAMSGIRDMSTIEEAPQDRRPVQTYVIEQDTAILTEAIRRELRRGGQVFYLHNHIDSIASCAARIQAQLPDARILTAHGRMGEEELSRVWQLLTDHEIDILVCTTIIESGVDVPNCNTLIVEDADRLGLAQLYQIRGRVGRSNRRAYAYLTFRGGRVMNEVAAKRLEAIREFTSFGSGFRIALRDLEIRGAGNILGASQHGHMEAVGYEMYLKLLSEAIREEKGEAPAPAAECLVDVQVEAHIPESYISSMAQRIDVYKKIAQIAGEEDFRDVTDELIDRFGEPPQAVLGLMDVALLRGIAASLGIHEISQKSDQIIFYPDGLDFAGASRLSAGMAGRVSIGAGAKPYLAVRIPAGGAPIDTMRTALFLLAQPAG